MDLCLYNTIGSLFTTILPQLQDINGQIAGS